MVLSTFVTRCLFRLTLGLATALVILLFAAPLLDTGAAIRNGPGRVVALFSRDAVVRQTGLAAAAGLYVTAAVFFRSGPSHA